MIKKIVSSFSEFEVIYEYCINKKNQFLSTPFDLESIKFLDQFDMPFWKIPSDEITNYPYLVKIAKTGKAVVMSTGMSKLGEIEEVVNVLKVSGSEDLRLMHCNTEYPSPFRDVNLKAINTLKERFRVEVGYSTIQRE